MRLTERCSTIRYSGVIVDINICRGKEVVDDLDDTLIVTTAVSVILVNRNTFLRIFVSVGYHIRNSSVTLFCFLRMTKWAAVLITTHWWGRMDS